MPPLDSDAVATRALMLFTSRSGPLGMQPLFDLQHGQSGLLPGPYQATTGSSGCI